MWRALGIVLLLAGTCLAGPRCGPASAPEQAGLTDVLAQAPPPDPGPLDAPGHWPLSVGSAKLPLLVHYRKAAERPQARRVLRLLERAWSRETGGLGFAAPPSDGGQVGPDGRFDVFLWRGVEECYVDVLTGPDDAWVPYMVVDPWGPYGGKRLGATLIHELNHACQCAYTWDAPPAFFELTATFVELSLAPDADAARELQVDFQAHPERPLDWDDGYETWFMYGGALYFDFLRERVFHGDGGFAARLWARVGAQEEPDFLGALDDLLREEQGTRFSTTLPAFAAWRARAALPAPASAGQVSAGQAHTRQLSLALLGTVYLELEGGGPVKLRAFAPAGTRAVTQVLPGAPRRVAVTLLPVGPIPTPAEREALRKVRLRVRPAS